jgi:isoleucyl-tRNA synthetase
LLAGTLKDVVPRFWAMRGYKVERKWGWDCHGLPVENLVEKDLGLKSKTAIEEYGIGKFNEACRAVVLRYANEWKATVNRMGRWVDMEDDYKTMDPEYMESIWWVFKSLWDKKLIYEGNKIVPYCIRCATPLSNFETNQGYKDKQDPALTVKFELVDEPGTFLLAWTTTPWTLPSNLAVAVGAKLTYAKVQDPNGEKYILALDRIPHFYKNPADYQLLGEMLGKDLEGKKYKPLMPYYASKKEPKAFTVTLGDFVSLEDGTGLVHMAPFGEDDMVTLKKMGVEAVLPLDAEGKFNAEV